jgi:hypothetical protein
MKKNMLFLVLIVFFLGCETGTRYDKNATTQTVPKYETPSGLVERDDIEALLDDKEVDRERDYDDRTWIDEEVREVKDEVEEGVSSFSNTVVKNGLDVLKIREGKHDGYIRLVFDVYDNGKPAKTIGRYDAKYTSSNKDITVVLHGYQKFSAPLPSFPYYSVIEQIHFDQYPKNSGFKFHIKLRENAKVKIFELKNPARLVFDIKAI